MLWGSQAILPLTLATSPPAAPAVGGAERAGACGPGLEELQPAAPDGSCLCFLICP